MNKLAEKLKELAGEGLFHIFGSSVIAQVGSLISSIVVIRRLPKADYGYYVSAQNIYSYLSVFIGIGLASAIMQYCSEQVSDLRKNSIYKFSLSAGSISNIAVAAAILALSFLKGMTGDGNAAFYLALMSGLPFAVYLYNYFQAVLRVRLNNRAFSYSNIAYTAASLSGNIIFTYLFGAVGLIAALYLANIVAVVPCAILLKKEGFFSGIAAESSVLARAEKREISGYALTCAVTNFASTILVLLDVTCLDMVLADSAVLADYKVASTIPAACNFIPGCLITFFYPKLVVAFSVNVNDGKRLVDRLVRTYLLVNGSVFVLLCVFSRLIIFIFAGEKYLNVIPIFLILSVNYLVYSMRSLLGNVIAAIKKVKINLFLSVVSGVANIILNLCLITRFGSVGAAAATVTVTVTEAAMSAVYISTYYKSKREK